MLVLDTSAKRRCVELALSYGHRAAADEQAEALEDQSYPSSTIALAIVRVEMNG